MKKKLLLMIKEDKLWYTLLILGAGLITTGLLLIDIPVGSWVMYVGGGVYIVSFIRIELRFCDR